MTDLSELSTETAAFTRHIGGHLLRWAIRWTIGFALVAWATRRWEGLGWLWWAAGITAGLSLLTTLAIAWSVRRQMAQVGSLLMDLELENLTREALEEPAEPDSRPDSAG